MSGRPKDPDWTVEPWAPDTNYAAGALPWSGTATKVAWAGAPSVGITPRLGFPAQAFNYAQNKNASHDQSAKDTLSELVAFLGQVQIQNWPYFQVGDRGLGRVFTTGDAAWDANYNLWVCVVYGALGNSLYVSSAGDVWQELGSAFSGAGSIFGTVVFDPNNGHYYASYTSQIADWDWGTTSYTMVSTNTGRVFTTGKWFNGRAVFMGQESGAPKISTYTTAEGHINRVVPPGVTYSTRHASAVGNGTMVVIPSETLGADQVGVSSENGIDWLDVTFPTLADESISDIVYGNGVFMIAVNGTTDTKIYTSETGATDSWTLVKTLEDKQVHSFACSGSLWFAAWGTGSSGIFSLDNGATWGPCEGFEKRLGGEARARIANNGRQLLVRRITGTTLSVLGSFITGLPPQV